MRNQKPTRVPKRRTTLFIPMPLVYAGLLIGAAVFCLVLITSLGGALVRTAAADATVVTTMRHTMDDTGSGNLQNGTLTRGNRTAPPLSVTQQDASAPPSSGDSAQMAQLLPTATPVPPTPLPPSPTPVPPTPVPPTPIPPTPTAEVLTFAPLPERVAIRGVRHMWQTWNNCGPATLAMNLSYFGSTLDQAEIGAAIRTHAEDKNVNAQELADYARQQGFAAQARVNGTDDLLRRFLSEGIPVLIETWLQPEPNDGFGHYRLLTGYDDANQRWIAHDSYVTRNLVSADGYAGIYLPYAETDERWAVYNRTYVLVYLPEQAELVDAILGQQADVTVMWQGALARAEADIAAQQAAGTQTPFPWFNLGSSLYQLGRTEEAAAAFDQARAIGLPWRMLWYQFEPFAVYYEMGRYQDLVVLARTTLATTSSLEEVQYWYGMGLAALGDRAGARQAWEYALQMKPGLDEARAALDALGG